MVNDRFGGNRLTNAHNEWLTVLVDIGVLGLVSYAGMMITAIRDFLRAGENKMLVGACGICVLAYTVNNMFSFQQVMNISTVFVIMGIGENLRSAPERCVQSDTGHRCNTLRQTKISFHICGSLFFVVATRFELATSASRTQRSTKLSHATILLTRIASTLK